MQQKCHSCSSHAVANPSLIRPQGKYQHGRKNGCGVYHFTNGDVYQGQFANDRMEGTGVYAFGPEGLYEGGWKVGGGCRLWCDMSIGLLQSLKGSRRGCC